MASNTTTVVWGEMVDYADLRTVSRSLLSSCVLLMVFAIFVTFQRFYVRGKYAHSINRWVYRFGWFMPGSAILYTTACGMNIAAAVSQIDALDRDQPVTSTFTQSLQIASVMYVLATGLVKLSIYSHFNPPQYWAKSLLNWLVIIFVIFCTVFCGFILLPCGARAANNTNGACKADGLLMTINRAWSGLNLTSSVIMLGFATYEIYIALEVRLVKFVASFIFLIGALGTAASAARFGLLLAEDVNVTTVSVVSYEKLLYAVCATVELGLLIAAGCLVSLRPLVARWLGESQAEFEPIAGPYYGPRPDTANTLRPDTAATTKSNMTGTSMRKPLIMQQQRVVVDDWSADPVERRRKRLGLYVSAQELEDGLSPAASPLVR
ncbi:hypothetical protein K461DRAFT_291193 [Myriangium duriaei CBS 260.36]|uniref:Rhodopsin domain-containing protein n=1 Tax=Myriangium duriaei CBS 260.36 TaxID=1168546 RepID=A0A9P4MIR2_9PEZI|nr:hypothetical protein K461DRAFT_291193 [Myriangium duriaei CBS 260.36]